MTEEKWMYGDSYVKIDRILGILAIIVMSLGLIWIISKIVEMVK